MKKLAFVFCFILSYTLLCASPQISLSTDELDRLIEKRDLYIQQKEDRINSLKKELPKLSDNTQKLEYYNSLFNEYKSYKYDSAYVYAHKCLDIAYLLKDSCKIIDAKEHIAFCYLSSGLFKEASDIMNSVDIKNACENVKKNYYTLLARLYFDMADYNNVEPFKSQYISEGNRYCDSAIVYTPQDSPELWSIKGLKLMQLRDLKGAADMFLPLAQSSKGIDDHTYAIAASSLGFIYEELGDKQKAIHYMIEASIGDIISATKETVALRNLANLLYETGDVHKANKYVRLAMEDANLYNARHRKISISSILPIIEKERFEMVEKQRNILIGSVLIISVLFVLLLGTTIVIYKQVKKLRLARHTIQEQNKKLLSTNSKLLEANKIKDEYITQSIYGDSEYIDRIEYIYKIVNRKIVARQYEDIRSFLKESDLRKERENMYSSFDQTFLKLFPDFVEEYKKLFLPDDILDIDISKGLTPEIRIFALIRLGIHESERIAKFLNYSVNTINTYKTKVKNKSIIANELFEQKIMEIKTVQTN